MFQAQIENFLTCIFLRFLLYFFPNPDGVSSRPGSDDVKARTLANAMRARGAEIYAVSQGANTNEDYMKSIGTVLRRFFERILF
jgi:hypothetical protein